MLISFNSVSGYKMIDQATNLSILPKPLITNGIADNEVAQEAACTAFSLVP